jgi:hypothetical protein
MAQTTPINTAMPADMPELTDDHRLRAWQIVHYAGVTYAQAMQDPTRRSLIEACAKVLRRKDWERSHMRTVVPVRRVVLGADGHPIGWCTQMAQGPYTERRQHDWLEAAQ